MEDARALSEAEKKVKYGAEFLRCLLELDVPGIMRISRFIFPPDQQPSNPVEALASLHMARTESRRVPIKAKMYSQRWLNERGLGSHVSPRVKHDRREKQ